MKSFIQLILLLAIFGLGTILGKSLQEKALTASHELNRQIAAQLNDANERRDKILAVADVNLLAVQSLQETCKTLAEKPVIINPVPATITVKLEQNPPLPIHGQNAEEPYTLLMPFPPEAEAPELPDPTTTRKKK